MTALCWVGECFLELPAMMPHPIGGHVLWRAAVALLALLALADRKASADVAFSLKADRPFESAHGGGQALTAAGASHGSGASNLGGFGIAINPGPVLSLPENAPALAALQRAAAQWTQFISDPITVNINADLTLLNPGVISSATPVVLVGGYPLVRDAMVTDGAAEADDAITAALPTLAEASFSLPPGFAFGQNLQGTKANIKALGFSALVDALFGTLDGTIRFNTGVAFDFDNSDGVSPGLADFETAAAHEIGHVLGFISDLEYINQLMTLGLTSQNIWPTVLDVFRFADGGPNDPSTSEEFTTFSRSLIPSDPHMFDKVLGTSGELIEVPLSTGVGQGDGQPASHWKDNLALGVMDPTLPAGEFANVGANDLRALDLMGYDIAASAYLSAIPEARAWLLGAAAIVAWGLVPAVGTIRRRVKSFCDK
jgi:hypothetical protein